MPSSTNLPTRLIWRLDPGPMRPLVDRFTGHLASLGHTDLTVQGYGDAARDFSIWLQRSSVAVARIDLDTCAAFAAYRCRCHGARRGNRVSGRYTRRAVRFVRFLADCGVVENLASSAPASIDAHVVPFQQWLRQHRGITERTISKHGRMVTRLLAALAPIPRDTARADPASHSGRGQGHAGGPRQDHDDGFARLGLLAERPPTGRCYQGKSRRGTARSAVRLFALVK